MLLPLSICGCDGSEKSDYDYEIDIDDYLDAITVDDEDYLILANKDEPLGRKYKPDDLDTLDRDLTLDGKKIRLEATAALAVEALVLELWECGYEDIRVTSGYRDYDYQKSLFYTYMDNERKSHPDLDDDEIEEIVLTYSARPGTSEHQTGLCVDLISTEHLALDVSFEDNPAFEWLTENAHHFGFILRYPEDMEDVTGYSYEPWHYRFVGVKAATEIYEGEMVLEEYLEELD
jgi:D-alanyl-D-alanine carboxypeptidase